MVHPAKENIKSPNKQINKNQNNNEKPEKNIQEIWDTIKRLNLCIMGVEEGEESQVKCAEISLTKLLKRLSQI